MSSFLSLPPELHRNIVLHLHDPLSYSYTSRLVHGLFKRRPPFAEDPGRRGLGTLARTCVSMRETVFPVLFSRLVIGDYRVLQALTAGAAEDHEEDSGRRINSMKTSLTPSWSRGRGGDRSAAAARRACDHVKWLQIDLDLFDRSSAVGADFWRSIDLLLVLLRRTSPSLRILTFTARHADALILSHISRSVHLPRLSALGLLETQPRQTARAPADDPSTALVPLIRSSVDAGTLLCLDISTARGIEHQRAHLLQSALARASPKLVECILSLEGSAEELEGILERFAEDGRWECLTGLRIKIPEYSQFEDPEDPLGLVNVFLASLRNFESLTSISVGIGFRPRTDGAQPEYLTASCWLANLLPKLRFIFWAGYTHTGTLYAIRIHRRRRTRPSHSEWWPGRAGDYDETKFVGFPGGDFLEVSVSDLEQLGVVASEDALFFPTRTDDWAGEESEPGLWRRLLYDR